ncbi:MAG: gas vesicle protein K [Paracoccaceae bacterium]
MTDPMSPDATAAALARLLESHLDDAGRLPLDPGRVERDLARLVLAIVELLRQLLELQAIRRVEAGSLSAAEEERLGAALLAARDRIRELARAFGVEEAALDIDLAGCA